MYADSVNIISPVAYTYQQLLQYNNQLTEKNAIKLAKLVIPYCESVDSGIGSEIKPVFDQLEKYSGTIKSLPYPERLKYTKTMIQFMKDIGNTTIDLMGAGDCAELNKLIKNGCVNIEKFNSSISNQGDDFLNEFIQKLLQSINNSFPLFDKQANDLMNGFSVSNILSFSDANKLQIKDTAFTNELMLGLPSFEMLSIDEILDIKKEFNNALVRFRGKMLEYSNKIQSLPWNDEFKAECSLIYMKEIMPSLTEINEATRQNTFIKNLGLNLLTDKNFINTMKIVSIGVASSGLIKYLLDIAKLDKTVLMTGGITAGISAINKLAHTYQDYKDKQREIQKKDLFFYYTLNNLK